MTRQVLYVAHPVAPTPEQSMEIARSIPLDATAGERRHMMERPVRENIDRALVWLSWLRRSFPEVTFIAPWIASILTGEDDSDPSRRQAGLIDDCAVVERCDGIVLVGGRISSGMLREMEHATSRPGGVGRLGRAALVYDLTQYQIEGASGRNEDGRTFEQWMLGYQESCTR